MSNQYRWTKRVLERWILTLHQASKEVGEGTSSTHYSEHEDTEKVNSWEIAHKRSEFREAVCVTVKETPSKMWVE